jgi:RNA polymerase sigma-70 factor (family 1)
MQDKTVQRFQQGDKASYRSIFNTLYPIMCLFARKFIHEYEESEDIAQEIFIELWNQRAKFESFDQIKAFLYLSIKNRCLNFIKHLNIKEKYAQLKLSDNDTVADEYIIEAEVVQNLNLAINNLPEQQKQLILLSLQGLKNEEIADSMQLSVNTVKHYKKIAYQRLRNEIGSTPFLLLLL